MGLVGVLGGAPQAPKNAVVGDLSPTKNRVLNLLTVGSPGKLPGLFGDLPARLASPLVKTRVDSRSAQNTRKHEIYEGADGIPKQVQSHGPEHDVLQGHARHLGYLEDAAAGLSVEVEPSSVQKLSANFTLNLLSFL